MLPDLVSGPQHLAQQSALIFRAVMTLKYEGTLFFETSVTTQPATQCDTPRDPIPNLTLILALYRLVLLACCNYKSTSARHLIELPVSKPASEQDNINNEKGTQF